MEYTPQPQSEISKVLSEPSNSQASTPNQLMEAYSMLAVLLGLSLSPQRLLLTVNLLLDCPIELALQAIREWSRGERKHFPGERMEFLPTAAQLLDRVKVLQGRDFQSQLDENRDWILTYLRRHGTTKKKWGERYEEYRTPEGRLDMRRISEAIPTPELSPLLERTMTHMGGGEFKHGLMLMSRHPMAMSRPLEDDPETAKSIKWIDSRFEAAFARALREDR